MDTQAKQVRSSKFDLSPIYQVAPLRHTFWSEHLHYEGQDSWHNSCYQPSLLRHKRCSAGQRPSCPVTRRIVFLRLCVSNTPTRLILHFFVHHHTYWRTRFTSHHGQNTLWISFLHSIHHPFVLYLQYASLFSSLYLFHSVYLLLCVSHNHILCVLMHLSCAAERKL